MINVRERTQQKEKRTCAKGGSCIPTREREKERERKIESYRKKKERIRAIKLYN